MADKITFLGTGGDAEVVGKQILGSGGIIIQTNNNQFLIDPGPGCTVRAKMYKINLRENTAIMISSNSMINANDVNAAIDSTTIAGLDKKCVLVCNDTLMNSNDSYLNNKHKKSVERILVLNEGQKIGINDTEIQILKAKQEDENAIGFKFITPNTTIVYTGDTSFFPEMVEEYSDADVLILNMQQPFEEKEEGVMNADDAVKIIDKIKPKITVINHLGIKLMRKDAVNIGRDLQQQTGTTVTIAKDGSSIDLTGTGTAKKESLESYQTDDQEPEETTNS